MNEYIENLNEEDRKEVLCRETRSKSLFRFCDDVESKSIKTVNIPIVFGRKRVLLVVDVLKNNIPLLISKDTMSKLGMKKDFTRHEVEVNGQVMQSQCNSSSHYCIPLTTLARENYVVFHLTNLLSLSNEEKKKKATKLHHQLCHASKDQLVK